MTRFAALIRKPFTRAWGGALALALTSAVAWIAAGPDVVQRTLSSEQFMPHGHCYLWRPELVWLHALSDGLIALAYFSIPVALVILVRRRRDLPFDRVVLLFGAFVLACGTTHAMDVWTLWTPTYWLAGAFKAVTAAVSLVSAAVLVRTLPAALAFPDRLTQIAAVNARLRTSEERFRYVLEEVPLAMVIVDGRGLISLVNKSLEQMFGHSRAELIGHPVEVLVPDRFQGAHPHHRANFLADPRPRAMAEGRELAGLRKDGSEFPIEVGLTPLLQDGERQVIGSVVDISERRRAEVAMQKTFDALRSFQMTVERVKDYAIIELDADGCIRTWNAGARAIEGYESDEVIGRHCSLFHPPETSSHGAEELEIARAAGRYSAEGWRVRKDGSRFWADVIITAIPGSSPGSVSGFVKVTRDLTERKLAEDARANALRERTALLQEVHHRVKNNLQMIASLINMQARQINDEQARAVFLETRGRVRSIALLHESLYQSADLGQVDMREYVGKLVYALLQTMPVGAAPTIVTRVAPLLFPIDAAVPCGLVIHELVMNALKHAFGSKGPSQANRVEIDLTADGGTCLLVVQDNGVGFAKPVTPDEDATLGLTLVFDLTSQLEGSVDFETSGGARCRVTFPSPRASKRAGSGAPTSTS